MHIKIAIIKYTLIFSILVGAAIVLKEVLGVLRISKKIGGVAVK